MRNVVAIAGLIVLLAGCESAYDASDGLAAIRSQRDVDAYNATVTAENDKLVCDRESVIGSNIRQFVCMTVGQRETLRQSQQDDIELLAR